MAIKLFFALITYVNNARFIISQIISGVKILIITELDVKEKEDEKAVPSRIYIWS